MSGNNVNDMSTPINFLLTRRSYPVRMIQAPFPSEAEVSKIISAGLRVPDHKGLQPWRIVKLGQGALHRLSQALEARALHDPENEASLLKQANIYTQANTVLVCVYSPDLSSPLPEWEQFLSAGAVCLSLVNASLACGFAATWISGTPAEKPSLITGLDLKSHERIAGIVHIGSCPNDPVDRKRPDCASKISYL